MKGLSLILTVALLVAIVPVHTWGTASAAPFVPIQEIQSNTTDGDASAYNGQTVTTAGVVTAVTGKGFFIQNGTGAWSGIYVYLGTTPDVSVGDYVQVTGTVKEYYGLTEISSVSNVTKLGTAPVPEPVVLKTGDVAQEQWESVLVEVRDVDVTNADLGYGEWEIDDGSGPVRVDDLMYKYTPTDGEHLYYVRGVVYYSYGNFKIEPRSEEDIGLQPEYIPISEIQSHTSDGDRSVYDGKVLRTRGVVTAVAKNYKGRWYVFIQNGTGAWSGICLYFGSTVPKYGDGTPISKGDLIEVTGSVDEYYGFTEISDITNVTKLGTAPVPEPVVLKTGDVAQEQWESVLVEVRDVIVTNPYLGYGEWEVDDGSGPVRIDDLFYDYTPEYSRYLYIRGPLMYSYGNYKIEPLGPEDIEPYIPRVKLVSFEVQPPLMKGIGKEFDLKVLNNGTLTENVRLVVVIGGKVVVNVTAEIEAGGEFEYSFYYTPNETGELPISVILYEANTGELLDIRNYLFDVKPNINAVSFGLTARYVNDYQAELSDLNALYANFTEVVNKLEEYGVKFDPKLAQKIEWINANYQTVEEEYALYLKFLHGAEKTGFYLPPMLHIRIALFTGEKVKAEILDILPVLQKALKEIEKELTPQPAPVQGNETATNQTVVSNQTASAVNVTITIPSVLIDASHNQYYVNKVGVNGLVENIKSDLGWDVEINYGPLTYDTLKDYDVVIILNPGNDLTDDEIVALREYVENGGGLILAGDWYKYVNPTLNKVLEGYGLAFEKTELMDDEDNSGRPYYPYVGVYNRDVPITKFIPDGWKMYYNGDTIAVSGNAVWVIRAFETSYAVNADGNVVHEKGTQPVVAAAVQVGKGRIVVYGSSKGFSDSYNGNYISTTWPFIKGALMWLVGEI